MKLNIGDSVLVKVADNQARLTVTVEDASKSDIIQAKVSVIAEAGTGAFTYEIGKVYEFDRKDIQPS